MPNDVVRYPRYRFPSAIISHAVWLYYRFTLSFRDVEDLPRPTRHHRVVRIHPALVRNLWPRLRAAAPPAGRAGRRHVASGRTLCDDSRSVSLSLAGRRPRWRHHRHPAPAPTGSPRRRAVLRKLLKRSGRVPHRLVTDRLGSYRAAHRVIMPSVVHDTTRYANNRAEVSHQPTRRRERHMRRFKSVAQARRFLAVHDAVRNLFTIGRHRLRAGHQRLLRSRAFVAWNAVAAA